MGQFGLSAPDEPRVTSEDIMKKMNTDSSDDMRTEYDFASMKGGVRGKYVKRFREGTNLVLIDPDLMDVFPDEASVNQALRALAPVLRQRRRAATKRRSA